MLGIFEVNNNVVAVASQLADVHSENSRQEMQQTILKLEVSTKRRFLSGAFFFFFFFSTLM